MFLGALKAITGRYLQVDKDASKSISVFPEPIGKVAEMYSRELTPQELALELGFEKVELLQAKIEASRELLRFGLGTMIQKPPGTLKREKWETPRRHLADAGRRQRIAAGIAVCSGKVAVGASLKTSEPMALASGVREPLALASGVEGIRLE